MNGGTIADNESVNGSDDKIMIWNNMDSFSPICEVFTLPKEEAPTSQS